MTFSYIKKQENANYQSLVEAIKQRVECGKLVPGEKLPTLAILTEQTGLAGYSVRKAVALLVEEGILETEQGGGMYVSRRLGEARIAIADAFRFADSYPQLRHPITISGIYSQASEKGTAVDLLRPDTDFTNPDAVMAQLKVGGYDGLIWLYPEEDRMDCIDTISKEIPIVLTSHSRTDFNLPAVESDESHNAVRVGRHFLSCRVPGVVQFVEPWIVRTSGGAHSGGHISGINSLKLTLLDGGMRDYSLVSLGDSELKYRSVFMETLEGLEDGSGIFLANTDCFRAVMDADFDRLVELLHRCNVIIGTTEVDNNSLARLAEHVGIITCVNPLAKIGSISFQKVMNILEGLNEDTATIVRISFGRFCELDITERQVQSCAV